MYNKIIAYLCFKDNFNSFLLENLLSVKPYEYLSLKKWSQANVVDSCSLKQLDVFCN